MTKYKTYNRKLSNLELIELKPEMKNGTELTLKLSLNVDGDSNDKNSSSHKLLLINTQLSRFPEAFVNGSSANIKLPKPQLHKLGKSGRFPGRMLQQLLKTGLPFLKKYLNH